MLAGLRIRGFYGKLGWGAEMYHSFEELEAWKRACNVAVRVYEELRECRDFGIRNQIQRSAVSIASNIAEGAERGGRDFSRFLRIARGSGLHRSKNRHDRSELHGRARRRT